MSRIDRCGGQQAIFETINLLVLSFAHPTKTLLNALEQLDRGEEIVKIDNLHLTLRSL